MQKDQSGDALVGQIPVSPNNPCPFMRALVARGLVRGGTVPLPKLTAVILAAGGQHGLKRIGLSVLGFTISLIGNGLSPSRLWRTLWFGADLDQLRDGTLDKHGGGSRILDAEAHVRTGEIDRFAGFGSDWPNPAGGYEHGLNEQQIITFINANLQRAGKNRRWFWPGAMRTEWLFLLLFIGKGEGSNRYLSAAEIRTLFAERQLPERIVARITRKPTQAGTIRP